MSQQHPTTRERLIDAGIRLFREGRASILRSLTAGTVADAAGYHRQTFYRNWNTQCEYVEDLMEVVFECSEEPPEPPPLPGPSATTFEAQVLRQTRSEIDRLWDDPRGAVRIGLLVMGQLTEGRPRELAEAFYQDSVRQLEGAFAKILADHSRRPVAPLSLEDLARAVRAQLSGFVLESAFLGDRRRARGLFEVVVVQVVTDLTEPVPPDPEG